MGVALDLPYDLFHATRLSPTEVKRELALHLFVLGKLSFGKARELADMDVWSFLHLLGSRDIPVHYDVAELDEDLDTLRALKRL